MQRQLKNPRILIYLFVALFIVSCGEGDEPGVAQVGVKMEAVSAGSSFSSDGRIQNTITFTDILIGVTELELETQEEDELEDDETSDSETDADSESESEDEDEGEIEFEGNYVVDLIAGTSTPDFGLTALPVGNYKELEIEMEPILEGGHTIYIGLDFLPDNATDPIQVVYTYDGELEFELESHAGFQLDGTGVNQILVLLDLDVLMSGIDLNTAQAGEDGIVRINAETNVEINTMLKHNLAQVLKAGEDDDDDGEFDDDEDDKDED